MLQNAGGCGSTKYFACRVYLRKHINEEKSETTKLNL